MLKRYEDTLGVRLDAVAHRGFVFIEWWELNVWYDKDRITKTVYRDLRDRFKAISAEETDELYVYPVSNGAMLIHSDGLKKILPSGEFGALDEAPSPSPDEDE